ncbi:TrmH family RNA methyltransferase [Formosa algae]|uniref:tRNA G18 (Ribose-2'-O)-methylase SpoU n=1 Tax=Formosa algae TaxID=225843 RepID=A0A9X0YJH9_9FLAO|nr:TrmH family RNA methyltransferase [Formosa algae]MBP1839977.1 tRNA G18 (ribose-2'-O)-methylase SpoU [Formosa algae]MDQ0335576.1 tRNA G18 (ribose-2'-O)-methylase SpoU [Formosa algae]OEI81727.1 RNA methyltransferase [Formosa algae]PNW28677.1 RNA methyltransferase [Formosa algae]
MAQLNHYNTNFSKKTFPITLVCDHVTNAPNIGSLFRTADAFGVEKLILCGSYIPLGRKMTKTSRATEKVVPFEVKADTSEVIAELKSKGYQIIALEITDSSISLREAKFSSHQPIALLIGDENFGVSEALLKASDLVVHIDMFGQNSSMNVVQATNIILYEITKQSI